jgi:acyl-CoA synthetase (AMP-forming)/AMP-acid ligase II
VSGSAPIALADDLVERLIAAGSQRGAALAMREASGTSIDYRSLASLIDNLAAGLHAAGLRPGDRIAFAIRPSIASTATLLACLRAGVVPVLVDPGIGPELLAARMALAGPRAVAADSVVFALTGTAAGRWLLRRRGVSLASLADLAPLRIRAGRWLPGLPRGSVSLLRLAREGAGFASWRPPILPAGATRAVIFTSGTTGDPKGVRHSGGSLGSAIAMVGSLAAFDERSVLAGSDAHLVVPMLLAGGRVELPPGGAHSLALLRHANRVSATHLSAVPIDADAMAVAVAAGGAAFPRGLRLLVLGSAPVGRRTLERLRATLPATTACWSAYGATEVLPIAAVSLDAKLAFTGAGNLVGAPLPGVEIRISDEGEIMVDGPNRAPGYLGGPDLAVHATGDLGALLPDGQLALHGRSKEMLLRRGVNIYPGLYEPTIERIPGVAAAVMVGEMDPETHDERVVLFVSPTDPGCDRGALVSAVRANLAAGPSRIDGDAQPDEIIVLDQIPVAGRSRKPDRAALRLEAARRRTGVAA